MDLQTRKFTKNGKHKTSIDPILSFIISQILRQDFKGTCFAGSGSSSSLGLTDSSSSLGGAFRRNKHQLSQHISSTAYGSDLPNHLQSVAIAPHLLCSKWILLFSNIWPLGLHGLSHSTLPIKMDSNLQWSICCKTRFLAFCVKFTDHPPAKASALAVPVMAVQDSTWCV